MNFAELCIYLLFQIIMRVNLHFYFFILLQVNHPDFVIGFDIAGDEIKGPYAIDLIDFLLSIPPEVKFFFHAGETNFFGTSVDSNLVKKII